MILTIVLWICLTLATLTGIWTLHRNESYFNSFTVSDMWEGRLDGWIYALNILSTAWCFVDLALQLTLAFKLNWVFVPMDAWHSLWLGLHAGAAFLAMLIHMISNSLLLQDEFRELCKQPRKRK